VPELEALAAEHPFRERLRAQQMLALYRSGRQADALRVFREARHALVESFGIEPSDALQELERAILTHDAALELGSSAREPDRVPVRSPAGAVIVAPSADGRLDGLLAFAVPLARRSGTELLVARLVANESELAGAAAALAVRREGLGARTAAFTSDEPDADLVRLASANEADLVLVDAPEAIDAPAVPAGLARLLDRAPAHVAVLSPGPSDPAGAVYVPFGGGEHDWAALELGAWLASATGAPLRLVGTRADPRSGRRDASRLLADASLAVQRLVDVDAAPVLADRDERALVEAVVGARVVVVGFSPRWRHEGIGDVRRALVRAVGPPVLLVHRGPRPGGLAPHESRTRFTWTVDPKS
jgi:hypothetical protein